MDAAQTQASKDKMHTLLEVIQQGSNVSRYSSRLMHTRDNLLEHIGFTALFCYSIARVLKNKNVRVNMAVLMEKAVLHDVEEKLTGDVIRQTKHSSAAVRDGINNYSERAIERLEQLLGFSFLHEWKEAKDETLEGRIVQLADLASVVSKCIVEVGMLGNQAFSAVVRNTAAAAFDKLDGMEKTDPLYEYIEALYIITDELRNALHPSYGTFSKGF